MDQRRTTAQLLACCLVITSCGERDRKPVKQPINAYETAYQAALRCYHAYAFATSYAGSYGNPSNVPLFKAKQDEAFERLVQSGASVGKSTGDVLKETLALIDGEKFGDRAVTKQRLQEAMDCDAAAL